MGCLNPWMYANPTAFTDVTVGWDSRNAGDKSAFPCSAGWDPVTGLGTPRYHKMVEAALKAGASTVATHTSSDLRDPEISSDVPELDRIAARVNADSKA